MIETGMKSYAAGHSNDRTELLSQGSERHVRFLREQRTTKLLISMARWGLLIVGLLLWQLGTMKGWINSFLFSSPLQIAKTAIQMTAEGNLLHHIYITVGETIAGFLLSTIIGTLIAALLWWSPFSAKVLDPYLVVFNSTPKVALGPIFIVAFGQGTASIMWMALAISVIVTTLVVYSSFQEVDEGYQKLVRSFGATKRQLFVKVIFPASLQTILSSLKVNVGLSWIGVIVGEFLVAKAGLGYLIIYGFQVFNLTWVMMSVLIIMIVATIMYQIVSWIEAAVVKGRTR